MSGDGVTQRPKRVRRTPEEARRVILDAAEQIVARSGPGGLRLQEVAEAAGVSHPTILHHFESREGLILALNRRTLDELGEVMRAQMEASGTGGGSGASLHAAFAAHRGGFAQRIVWMLQSGALRPEQQTGPQLLDEMAERLHALRASHAPPDRPPDPADSRAVVHLITIAAMGDALVGPRLRRAADAAEEARQRAAFEDWLAALIDAHVRGG
jgi:AcrR family transcriptional regulator